MFWSTNISKLLKFTLCFIVVYSYNFHVNCCFPGISNCYLIKIHKPVRFTRKSICVICKISPPQTHVASKYYYCPITPKICLYLEVMVTVIIFCSSTLWRPARKGTGSKSKQIHRVHRPTLRYRERNQRCVRKCEISLWSVLPSVPGFDSNPITT